MLSKVAPNWMDVKRDLMSVDKTEQTVVIAQNYRDFDFILLQEATAALVPAALMPATLAAASRTSQSPSARCCASNGRPCAPGADRSSGALW